MTLSSLFLIFIQFVFVLFLEKDTMDIWCNGQKIETAVSMIPNYLESNLVFEA